MASSTLISLLLPKSCWLPTLLLQRSHQGVCTRKKVAVRTIDGDLLSLLKPDQPRFRHLLQERASLVRERRRRVVDYHTDAKVNRVRGKPCRRPGKTRFPGKPARLRTRRPEPAPSSRNAQFASLRSCSSRFTLAPRRRVSKRD